MRKLEKARRITKEEEEFLFTLNYTNITLETTYKLFGTTQKHPKMFNPYDWFILPKGKLYNERAVQTTVGKFILNALLLSPKIGKLIGYQNVVLNDDGIGDLDNKMSKLLLEDTIDTKEFAEYIDKMQWLGFSLSRILNTSMTLDLVMPVSGLETKKKELFSKYHKEIENGDIVKFNEIEKELLNYSKEKLKDCPDFEIYESGARGSFSNSYKNGTIARGGISKLDDINDYYISKNSLLEGIPPEETDKYADLMTQASYNRAVGTRQGGLTTQAHLLKINFSNCWNVFFIIKY